ncbi:MAG: hypothetical protein ABIW76_08080 [Fibrobacteria bacterium]
MINKTQIHGGNGSDLLRLYLLRHDDDLAELAIHVWNCRVMAAASAR